MFSKTVYSPEFSFLNSSKHRIAIVLVSSLESFLADQWPTERLYKVISDPVGKSIYYSAAPRISYLCSTCIHKTSLKTTPVCLLGTKHNEFKR